MKRLLYLFGLVILTSCSYHLPPDFTDLTGYHASHDRTRLAAVTAEMQHAADEVHSFQALAEVSIKKFPGTHDVRQVIVFERPGSLRLEFFQSSLNKLSALLTAYNGEMRAVDLDELTAYSGPATPENLEKIISLPLDAEQVMLLLTGRIAPLEQTRTVLFESSASSDSVLRYALPEGPLWIQLEHISGTVRLARAYASAANGSPIFDVRFEYRPEIERAPTLPSAITFNLPRKKMEMHLVYKHLSLNPVVAPEKFQLHIPDGMTVKPLE